MKNLSSYPINNNHRLEFAIAMAVRLCEKAVVKSLKTIESEAEKIQEGLYKHLIFHDMTLAKVNSLPAGILFQRPIPLIPLSVKSNGLSMSIKRPGDRYPFKLAELIMIRATGDSKPCVILGYEAGHESFLLNFKHNPFRRVPARLRDWGLHECRNAIRNGSESPAEFVVNRLGGVSDDKEDELKAKFDKITATASKAAQTLVDELAMASDFAMGLRQALKPIRNLKAMKDKFPELFDDFVAITEIGESSINLPAVVTPSGADLNKLIDLYKTRKSQDSAAGRSKAA